MQIIFCGAIDPQKLVMKWCNRLIGISTSRMFHYDLQSDCTRAINLLSVRYEELVILMNNFLHTNCKSAPRKLHTRAILGIVGGSRFSYRGRRKSHFFSLRVSMGAKKKKELTIVFTVAWPERGRMVLSRIQHLQMKCQLTSDFQKSFQLLNAL